MTPNKLQPFLPQNEKVLKNLIPFLIYFMRHQWKSFTFITIAMVVWGLNEALYPYFTKELVNEIEKFRPGLSEPFKTFALPLTGLLGSWFLMEISMRTLGFVSVQMWPTFRKNIREAVFHYTQGHSHRYFSNHFAGSLSNKISELPRSCEIILDISITSFFAAFITFCFSIGIIFQVNKLFGLILTAWIALFSGITFAYLSRVSKASEVHAECVSVLNGRLVDSLSSMISVRLFARTRYEFDYLKRYQDDEIQTAKRASWLVEEMNLFRGFLSFIFIVSMFLGLIYGWNQGWVTLGDFSLIAMSAFNLMGLIWHCAYNISHVVREVGSAQAALSLLSVPHEIQDKPNSPSLKAVDGTIDFDHVTFQYPSGKVIFEDLSLHIPSGQKVGFVGLSGSGKTTATNLLLRLYDIQQGSILIDNQNIADVAQDSLRENIAIIPQDPALFHRSLFENILYGRLNATVEEVHEAAQLAHCTEFIEHLENGFETIVGERGVKLSGGQRQRIAIARAILKREAPILIMDEATSALDSETEKLIQESLKEVTKKRTSLLIAHRLSTLKNMDRILVFHQGKIIEDGTVRELLRLKGHFYRLWHMQSGGFLPDSDNH